uniref:pigment epithelium-derived factor-like n=1 Tax=Myxine glutinosa TaxID=7769 RepID=UPI0035901743
MKMHFFILLILCTLSSFTRSDPETGETVPDEEEDEELTAEHKLTHALGNFGIDLFRQALQDQGDSNYLLSPLPIGAGLVSMMLGSTSGSETQQQLSSVLQLDTLRDMDVGKTLQEVLKSFNAGPQPLRQLARLYVKRRLRPKKDFVALHRQLFGSALGPMIGRSQHDLSRMNQWLRKQLPTTVRDAVAKLPDSADLILLSAALLQAELQFQKTNGIFHLDAERTERVPFLTQDSVPMKYGFDTELDCEVGGLPLAGNSILVLFLPKEITKNLSAIVHSLSAEFTTDIVNALHDVNAKITLPILKLKQTSDLTEPLKQMGLTHVFSSEAQLKLISDQSAPLTSVKHFASLQLKHRKQSSHARRQDANREKQRTHILFNVDRPFVLAIQHVPTRSLLYVGRIYNPVAAA